MYINLDGGGGEKMVGQQRWKPLKQAASLPSFRRGAMSVDSGLERGLPLPDGFPVHGSLHFQVTDLMRREEKGG